MAAALLSSENQSYGAKLTKFVWILVACLSWSSVAMASSSMSLHIENRVPRFVAFYHAAVNSRLDERARWALWQKEYGIAAVPPTAQGQALARKQLDAAWPRYASLVPELPTKEIEAVRAARQAYSSVLTLLKAERSAAPVKLLLFVGQFSGNEFTAPPHAPGDPPLIVMPVETHNIKFALTQEFVHAVQMDIDHLHNGFAAPLGETVLTVGLAMRATQALLPGRPTSLYTWRDSDWLARCDAHKREILSGMLPYLARSDEANTTRFTFGTGTTGLSSEAYCAGWVLVGNLLRHGYTFRSLARMKERRMAAFAHAAITAALDARTANYSK
ncbi:MAG: hypothetical protein ACRDFX_10565 [Chloroflexota bacterium]